MVKSISTLLLSVDSLNIKSISLLTYLGSQLPSVLLRFWTDDMALILKLVFDRIMVSKMVVIELHTFELLTVDLF